MTSIFDQINKAKVFGTGQFFQAGEYEIEINAVKFIDGYKGQSFIIESKVLESSSEEIEVGSIHSQVIKLENKETGPGNVKKFLSQAFDINPEDKDTDWGELARKACGDENPMAGLRLHLSAYTVDTKKGGKFTVHDYTKPVSE